MLIIQIILIIIFAIIPSLLSLLLLRKAKQRWELRLRRARTIAAYRQQAARSSFHGYQEEETKPSYIGDISCAFNARSPYIRCAVNPDGPCEGCIHYQKRGR